MILTIETRKIAAFVILLIFAVIVQIFAIASYPMPIYYDTEADCRTCHGIAVDRHHLLVPNGTYNCINCHAVKWSVENQTYYPEVIRDCLVCHSGKNHTDTHHLFVEQGLYVCMDCHQMKWDNSSQSYYPEIFWDCTVCHSTVLKLNDSTPPGSISSLNNATYAPSYINWTWIDPQDADLKEVMIYINGTYITNVLKGVQYYNLSSLLANTEYTIATRTIDTSENINYTFINHTAWTAPDIIEPTPSPSPTPPLSSPTGLHAQFDCSICHASGKTEEDICYQCHNDSVNSYNGINILYQFNIRNNTFAGLGIYNTINTRHDISDIDQNYSLTKLECTNCHGAHLADRINMTIDPDTGAPYNNTMIHPGSNETIVDSITYCLKCHDNSWAPDVAGPSIITNISDVYNDPSIFGDEHGAASGRGNSRLIGVYESWGRSRNVPPLPCTDCHDPHGSKGIYHLKTLKDRKGKNITITSNNINKHDVAHWCSNCHSNPMNQLSGRRGNCLNSGCHIHGRKY